MKKIAISTIAFCTVMAASNAALANVCKPLDTSACQEAAACYWVKGYTNTKGEMIKGHCRPKPSKPKK